MAMHLKNNHKSIHVQLKKVKVTGKEVDVMPRQPSIAASFSQG